MENNLSLSVKSSPEKLIAARLLKANPGLGEKSMAIAGDIVDSGLSPAITSMLMLAVYAPNHEAGRGQGTRLKWFIETVQNRYSHKLDKIRTDPKQFRLFVSDIEEVVAMRDTINGEGYAVSFQGAFLLWELGYDADSVCSIASEMCSLVRFPGTAVKMIVRAALSVKSGHFMTIEAALESMTYGYEHDRTTTN